MQRALPPPAPSGTSAGEDDIRQVVDIPIRGDAPELTVPPMLHFPNIEEVPGVHGVVGIDRYALRVLPIVGPRQYVVVPAPLYNVAVETLRYHDHLGLPGTRIRADHILPVERRGGSFCGDALADPAFLAHASQLNLTRLEPFYSNPGAAAVGRALDLPVAMPVTAAICFNDKSRARRWLESHGVRTPGGVLVRKPTVNDIKRLVLRTQSEFGPLRVGITVPSSCSGVGIHRVNSADEVDALMAGPLAGEPELIVEPWLDHVVGSPSVQVWLDDDPELDHIIGITDQILRDEGSGGPAHLGNLLPSEFAPILATVIRRTMAALRDGGVRGIAGADLIVRNLDGRLDVLVVEINARQTGAIYGAVVGHRALAGRPGHAFVNNNVPVPKGMSLDDAISALERAGVAWSAGRGEGVIITCAAALGCGKLMVVGVGASRDRVKELITAAEQAPYAFARGAA